MKIRRTFTLLLTLCMIFCLVPITNSYAADAADEKEFTLTRIAGGTRYETAIALAEAYKEEVGQVENVIITSGTGFADALASGPLGYQETAPILLSSPSGLKCSYIG